MKSIKSTNPFFPYCNSNRLLFKIFVNETFAGKYCVCTGPPCYHFVQLIRWQSFNDVKDTVMRSRSKMDNNTRAWAINKVFWVINKNQFWRNVKIWNFNELNHRIMAYNNSHWCCCIVLRSKTRKYVGYGISRTYSAIHITEIIITVLSDNQDELNFVFIDWEKLT